MAPRSVSAVMPPAALAPPLLLLLLLAKGEEDARFAAFSQSGWSRPEEGEAKAEDKDRPPLDAPIVVVLALKQRNLEFLEEQARRVSDPDDRSYGQYMRRDEVNSIAGPSPENVKAVREFLSKRRGVVQFSRGHDLARFACSVACIEETFHTKLARHTGETKPGNSPFRAIAPIRLPNHVAAALDGVSLNAPLFMPPRPKAPVKTHFKYPHSGRTAPRVDPFIIAGDEFVGIRFVAFCKDGKVNVDSLQEIPCSSNPPHIVSFEILILQQPQWQKVLLLPASSDVLGQRRADCGRVSGCMEFNSTIGSIQNFASTTARIRTHYSDGSVSELSPSEECFAVWPQAYTTPALLSKLYGIPLNRPIKDPRNIIAVAEFLGQYYNPLDLETFFRLMGIRSWDGDGKTQPRIVGPDEAVAGSVLGGEAQLDIQYMMAMAANVTTVFWSVPDIELGTTQEPFLEWLMQVADSEGEGTPLVHSVSYSDDEKTMPWWFKKRVNEELMKLALRGITVLVASGDDGASGIRTRFSYSGCSSANPMFPASSPWVTSVGGTQLAKAHAPVCSYASDNVYVACNEQGEVACTIAKGGGITSGGGFSTDFPSPWYQQGVVNGYFRQTDSPVPDARGAWGYNASGRGYPDIAGVASNYLVWMGDHLEPTSGTSASTPLVAATVAQLNEQRLRRGQPPLGFLNPLLYRLGVSNPEAFNDVVIGDNRCGVSRCCEVGFGAARGWDAVTGFGSLNFGAVSRLLMLHSPPIRSMASAGAPSAGMLPPAGILAEPLRSGASDQADAAASTSTLSSSGMSEAGHVQLSPLVIVAGASALAFLAAAAGAALTLLLVFRRIPKNRQREQESLADLRVPLGIN